MFKNILFSTAMILGASGCGVTVQTPASSKLSTDNGGGTPPKCVSDSSECKSYCGEFGLSGSISPNDSCKEKNSSKPNQCTCG